MAPTGPFTLIFHGPVNDEADGPIEAALGPPPEIEPAELIASAPSQHTPRRTPYGWWGEAHRPFPPRHVEQRVGEPHRLEVHQAGERCAVAQHVDRQKSPWASATGRSRKSSGRLLEAAWPELLDGAGIKANDDQLANRIHSLQLLRMLELLAGDSLSPGVERAVADRLHTHLRRRRP